MTTLDPEGLEKAAEALTPIADVDGMGPTFDQLRPVDQEWVTNMARAAVTAYLDAQTVTTVEELDALPVATVICDLDGNAWQKWSANGDYWWETTGSDQENPEVESSDMDLPATVIYRPAS